MTAPNPTPRDRAAALRAGADALAEAQEALRRAEGHFRAHWPVVYPYDLTMMQGALTTIADAARTTAQRLEAHDD